MFRCRDCGEIFDEPNYIEVCWEDYYGVSSMLSGRNYGTIVECPYCHGYIDIEEDQVDEDDIEEEEEWED